MSLLDNVANLLSQYTAGTASEEQAGQHFQQLAQSADAGVLAQGISAAMRSDQTPAFANIVSQLVTNASGAPKAGVVNALLSAASPALQSQFASLLTGAPSNMQVSEQHVESLSPSDVAAMAQKVEAHNPGIVETMSSFYAQHPALVTTLGSAAMAIAMR